MSTYGHDIGGVAGRAELSCSAKWPFFLGFGARLGGGHTFSKPLEPDHPFHCVFVSICRITAVPLGVCAIKGYIYLVMCRK